MVFSFLPSIASELVFQLHHYWGIPTLHVEKAMAPHSSTLAWKIPWMEEPGRLQSTGSLRVRHDWTTSLSLFTFMHWKRKWQPTPVFLPGEFQGWESWWAAVYGVAQSQTQPKWLSSSSSSGFPEKTIIQTDTCTPMYTAALFTIARTRKQTRCPLTDE